MDDKLERITNRLNKYCRERLLKNGPWNACKKETCYDCDMNEKEAKEILEALK